MKKILPLAAILLAAATPAQAASRALECDVAPTADANRPHFRVTIEFLDANWAVVRAYRGSDPVASTGLLTTSNGAYVIHMRYNDGVESTTIDRQTGRMAVTRDSGVVLAGSCHPITLTPKM